MDQFVLNSASGISVVFHSRQYDEKGWLDLYSIDLEAENFRASVTVYNPGYGYPPSQLFDDLADHWSGWIGTKSWSSMEGELQIKATADALGHARMEFIVPSCSHSASWSASARLFVEAGQLARLAAEARAFFNSGGGP